MMESYIAIAKSYIRAGVRVRATRNEKTIGFKVIEKYPKRYYSSSTRTKFRPIMIRSRPRFLLPNMARSAMSRSFSRSSAS